MKKLCLNENWTLCGEKVGSVAATVPSHTNKAFNVGADDGSAVPDVVESIYLFGKDIKILHLNDNNGFTHQHLPPFMGMQGRVKWTEVFTALDNVCYDGYYNFELALNYLRDSMEDYVHFLGKHLRRVVNGEIG